MEVVDIADEIYRELGSPTDYSISAIAFWVRTNIGELNNLLMAEYIVHSSTLEIKDESNDPATAITPEAVSILKKMYRIHFYDLEIKKNLISISTDSIISVSDQGSSVRKINRNEVSKTLSGLRMQEVSGLTGLMTAYRLRSAEPRQVAGDDTVEGEFRIDDTTLRNGLY